jgi:hypothetical protein
MSLPITRIRTDNPEKEIWRYLRLFTHEAYVKKFVKDKQAKALNFLKNPTIDQNNLKHHGLSGGGVSSNIDKFLDSKLQVAKSGIFQEFSKLTTKNRILLCKTVYEADTHHEESWVNDCEIKEFLESSEFKVRDLFLLVPEILSLLYYLGVENNLLIPCHISIRQRPNGKFDCLMNISKKLDLETFKKTFPELNEYKEVQEKSYEFSMMSKLQDNLVFPKRIVQAETRELFLINSDSNNNSITDLNVHFLLMFLLSHIARYKAPLLSEILEGRKRKNGFQESESQNNQLKSLIRRDISTIARAKIYKCIRPNEVLSGKTRAEALQNNNRRKYKWLTRIQNAGARYVPILSFHLSTKPQESSLTFPALPCLPSLSSCAPPTRQVICPSYSP